MGINLFTSSVFTTLTLYHWVGGFLGWSWQPEKRFPLMCLWPRWPFKFGGHRLQFDLECVGQCQVYLLSVNKYLQCSTQIWQGNWSAYTRSWDWWRRWWFLRARYNIHLRKAGKFRLKHANTNKKGNIFAFKNLLQKIF